MSFEAVFTSYLHFPITETQINPMTPQIEFEVVNTVTTVSLPEIKIEEPRFTVHCVHTVTDDLDAKLMLGSLAIDVMKKTYGEAFIGTVDSACIKDILKIGQCAIKQPTMNDRLEVYTVTDQVLTGWVKNSTVKKEQFMGYFTYLPVKTILTSEIMSLRADVSKLQKVNDQFNTEIYALSKQLEENLNKQSDDYENRIQLLNAEKTTSPLCLLRASIAF